MNDKKFQVYCDRSTYENQHVERFFNKYPSLTSGDRTHALRLVDSGSGLELHWYKGRTPLKYLIDFDKQANALRSYPAPKQGALNSALGKKSKRILDGTGGWGGDAMLMCLQGYSVIISERFPVMQLMLADALARFAKSDFVARHQVHVPVLSQESASEAAKSLDQIDCAYFDPMFPAKRKKSAASNKYMQFLQAFVGADDDAAEVAKSLLSKQIPRLAVKRPDYAEPLLGKPQEVYSSKLVHYDVYLNNVCI